MRNSVRTLIFSGILSILVVAGLLIVNKSAAQQNRESAGGHGTLIVQDGSGRNVRRQFSFNARRNADGTVTGHAVLHNPEFTGDNGRRYQAQFDISCMVVVGNTAILGGFARRTNDPNLMDAAFFRVQDNGEPGKNRDMISKVHFFDGNPGTTGDPSLCAYNDPFPMFPIESGNIQVRSNTP
jgi:hypothetical protein